MAKEDLRDLSDTELADKHDELKQDLFNLRFQMATGQLDNYRQLGNTKREIARVLTIQRQREIAAELEADEEADEA